MLLHINPATPHLFTFACIHTMALAVVDRDADTLHPVTRPHLGTITTAHIAAITAMMADLAAEPDIKLRIVHTSTVTLPEWLVFALQPNKLFILHTTTPAFLSPIADNWKVISPIADNPPIDTEDISAWLAKASQELTRLSPVHLELAALAPQ